MIARAASLLALIYLLGFVFFALTLGKPAPADASTTTRVGRSAPSPA